MEAMASGKLPQPDQTDAERLRAMLFCASSSNSIKQLV